MHPFLVDQTAYLPRPASSASSHSLASTSSQSTYSHAGPSRPNYHRANSSISSLASFTYTSLTYSTYTTYSSPSDETPVDLTCLRFMSSTQESDHVFGSVNSRASTLSTEERALRRELASRLQVEQEKQGEVEKKTPRSMKRLGRIF